MFFHFHHPRSLTIYSQNQTNRLAHSLEAKRQHADNVFMLEDSARLVMEVVMRESVLAVFIVELLVRRSVSRMGRVVSSIVYS